MQHLQYTVLGHEDSSDNVFYKHHIPRQLLPRGCALLVLTQCNSDGNVKEIHLSSTSDWYQWKSNNQVSYTLGIVFVEVNSLSLPISLNGIEVQQGERDFTIRSRNTDIMQSDGHLLNHTRKIDCLEISFTANEILQFVTSNSFLKGYFEEFINALPNWIGFSSTQFSMLETTDTKTELVYGREIDTVETCKGAPVISSNLYSIFVFDSTFSMKLFENEVRFPKPLHGHKFCLVVDICHNNGGSVFFMVPEESRHILTQFEVFDNLQTNFGLLIIPRGVGFSLVKGIQVSKDTGNMYWNGDSIFTYS